MSRKNGKNYVEIFSNGKKIYETDNLMVYTGRENIANMVFDSTSSLAVTHFGVGDGGTSSGSLISPQNLDSALGHILVIDSSIYPPDGTKKPIGSVSTEQDSANENKNLIKAVELYLTTNEANTPSGIINEAGLYTSQGSTFTLFARITFPDTPKDPSRDLTFLWYLFF